MHDDDAPLSLQEFIELKDQVRDDIEESIHSMLWQQLDGMDIPDEDKKQLIDTFLKAVRHVNDAMYEAGLGIGSQATIEGIDINTLVPQRRIANENGRPTLQLFRGGLTE